MNSSNLKQNKVKEAIDNTGTALNQTGSAINENGKRLAECERILGQTSMNNDDLEKLQKLLSEIEAEQKDVGGVHTEIGDVQESISQKLQPQTSPSPTTRSNSANSLGTGLSAPKRVGNGSGMVAGG